MKVEIRESPRAVEAQYPLVAKDIIAGQFVENEKGIVCFKLLDIGYRPSFNDLTHDLMVRTSDWTKGWCAAYTKFRALPNKEIVFIQNEKGQ